MLTLPFNPSREIFQAEIFLVMLLLSSNAVVDVIITKPNLCLWGIWKFSLKKSSHRENSYTFPVSKLGCYVMAYVLNEW